MLPVQADDVTTPETDAMNAIRQMTQSRRGRLYVVDGKRLVGVLSLKDMMEFLSTKLELERSPRSPSPWGR
jgi:CBS domain-containing protein